MATAASISNLGAYAHNPRGNLWFKDDSTYGHKLLMKMGWKQGKGLGKNEDGIKENLSVKFRNTNSGLGYLDDPSANVMKTEYEAILKNLNDKYSQNKVQAADKDKSFSQKSKVVKSKIRYPKLYFGKDVNKYSEKDMKSIFICSIPSEEKEKAVEDSSSSLNNEIESEGQQTCSTLSISDYFAKKMKERKNNILKEKDYTDLGHQEISLNPEVSQDLSFSKKSKKKKKNLEMIFVSESKDDSNLPQAALDFETAETADIAVVSSRKSSSCKKIKYSPSDISVSETNSPHDRNEHESERPIKKKRKLSQLVSESNLFENGTSLSSSLHTKQKKFKVHEVSVSSDDDNGHDMPGGKISCQIQLSPSVALRLNKQNKKDSRGMKSTNLPQLPVENCLQEEGKSIADSYMINNNSPSEVVESGLSNVDSTIATKRKKKGKKNKLKKLRSCLKNKSGSYSFKNVSFNESVSFKIIDSDYVSVDCLSDTFSMDRRACEIVNAVVENGISSVDSCASLELGLDKESTEIAEKVLDEDSGRDSDKQTENKSSTEIQDVLSKKPEGGCSLLSLPSPKSPYCNSWVEDQRQALKMKMYKKMLKSLKKHEILGTSNLVSISGYGNWGFK